MRWVAAAALSALLVQAQPVRGEPAALDLLGSVSFASSDLSALPQWTDAAARARADFARCRASPSPCTAMKAVVWRAKVGTLAGLSPQSQLFEANRSVNDLLRRPGDDACLPAAGTPWPTPLDALDRAGGPLARAVTKFFTLREGGWTAGRLRVAVVTDVLRDCVSAVVLAEHDGRGFVLDDVSNAVRDHASVRHYLPLYSFNETTRWVHFRRETDHDPRR